MNEDASKMDIDHAGEDRPGLPVAPPWCHYSQPEPDQGQIWRVSWDDTVVLAAIWRATPDDGRVMVRLLIEAEDLDVLGEICRVELAGGRVDVVLMRAAVLIPLAAFDSYVGFVEGAFDPPEDVFELGELAGWMEASLPAWADDDLLDVVDELAEELLTLSRADWIEVRRAELRLDADRLADVGIEPHRIVELVRGAAPLEGEAPMLQAAGLDPDELSLCPPPVRQLLDLPRKRAKIRAYANRHDQTELAARLDLSYELRLPVAAKTNTGKLVELEQRLDALLDE